VSECKGGASETASVASTKSITCMFAGLRIWRVRRRRSRPWLRPIVALVRFLRRRRTAAFAHGPCEMRHGDLRGGISRMRAHPPAGGMQNKPLCLRRSARHPRCPCFNGGAVTPWHAVRRSQKGYNEKSTFLRNTCDGSNPPGSFWSRGDVWGRPVPI
jgi:hypothetical protein